MHEVTVKSILSAKNGINIYRGCEHGCIYCDARSNCYQMNHAFEDIEVKANAIELLEKAFKSKRHKCMIGTGAMSDPYMPLEKDLHLTRQFLSLVDRYDFGATVLTKSDQVLNDFELIKKIHAKTKFVLQMTLTTCDDNISKLIEPKVCTTSRRAEVLNIFRDNGIPTVVWMAPILPFINDTKENIDGIIDYCIEAKVYGIICFGIGLTLRDGNREYFYENLDKHFPGLKQKYINKYGLSYDLPCRNCDELTRHFYKRCKDAGIETNVKKIFAYLNKYENKMYEQLDFINLL